MLHPWDVIRMRHRHEAIARGLMERDPAEVQELFDRFDRSSARIDAVRKGDWKLYVELGGDVNIARRADPSAFPVDVKDFD